MLKFRTDGRITHGNPLQCNLENECYHGFSHYKLWSWCKHIFLLSYLSFCLLLLCPRSIAGCCKNLIKRKNLIKSCKLRFSYGRKRFKQISRSVEGIWKVVCKMTEGNFVKQGDFAIEIGDIFTSKTQRLGKKDVTRICGADVTQICGRSKCEYNLHPKSKLMDVVDDKFSLVIFS